MSDSTPVVCAFYTYDTPYEEIVRNLEDSLISLGLRYHLQGYQSRGCWVANCGIKPEFLLDCLNQFDEPILYVDADSIVRREPEIDCDESIALYYKKHKNGSRELLSGTIYLKPDAKNLVNLWIQEQNKHKDRWDQKTLDAVINRENIKVHVLPQGYTKIYDNDWEEEPGLVYVEHYQASRKHKKDVLAIHDLPSAIGRTRIRKMIDGSFTIARPDKEVEAKFDADYIRVPNELRWLPYCMEGGLIESLRPIFQGKPCYIIGKGPSLDALKAEDFKPDVPIIAINHAIHKVEELGLDNTIYCMQQDMSLKDECKPKKATLLIAYAARLHYADVDNKIVFHMEEFQLKSCLTVIVAMRMVQRFGATNLWLRCFDSCVDRSIGYAKCVGHDPTRGGPPKRFLTHKDLILKEAKVPISFGDNNG